MPNTIIVPVQQSRRTSVGPVIKQKRHNKEHFFATPELVKQDSLSHLDLETQQVSLGHSILPPITQREGETAGSVLTLAQEQMTSVAPKADESFEFMKEVLGVDLSSMRQKLFGPTPKYHRQLLEINAPNLSQPKHKRALLE